MRLNQLAELFGLQKTQTKGCAGSFYGILGGYMITLSEQTAGRLLSVCVRFGSEEQQGGIYMRLSDRKLRQTHRITDVTFGPGRVTVRFNPYAKYDKQIRGFIDWFLPVLSASGAAGADTCAHCGQPLTADAGVYRKVNGAACRLHRECADQLEQQSREQQEDFAEQPKRYGAGIVGALLGALVGAIPWAVVYSLGWFVGYLGLLIGFAAKKGYELLGGRPGKAKIVIVLAAVLIGVVVGNFAGDALELAKMIAAGDFEGATYLDIPTIIFYTLQMSDEYVRGVLSNIGIGCFFSLLGVSGMLRNIHTEVRESVLQVEELEAPPVREAAGL